jgi:hypothetical protein
VSDKTGQSQPAESTGTGSCCTDSAVAANPVVTVQQTKADAGCGCVADGTPDGLPVVVIGAGPVGLAAAAHLAVRGQDFLVLEAGEQVGAAMGEWGHVRLFSPWRYNTDAAARRLLEPAGWRLPEADVLPTGADLVRDYLAPLARVPALAGRIRTGTRVVAVTRQGVDVTRTVGREERPLLVRAVGPDGAVTDIAARAVIDASGTWGRGNPLGHSGLPAPGEDAAAAHITGPLPDVLGRDRERFAGRRTLVAGMGHSAASTLLALAELAENEPGTRITWAVRGASVARLYGGGDADGLPARGALGTRLKAAVNEGEIDLVRGFTITGFTVPDGGPATGPAAGPVQVTGDTPDGARVLTADIVVAATGFRPDLDMLREVRVELDPATEAPVRLAPLIDPNFHSCGTVPPHGERDLAHPEPGFYLAGMKSYGRAPTFLMATGYEQVRSIVAALAGDREAADTVQLDLPETGVCSTSLLTEDLLPGATSEDGGCGTSCSTEPAPVAQIEPEDASCCGTPAPEPVGIGIGVPAGVGFATGRVHGYSGEAEGGDA